jgi:hypothetical protein
MIETLQRKNQLLQQRLGASKDFRIDMNDANSVLEWLHHYNTPEGDHILPGASLEEHSRTELDSEDSPAISMSSNSLVDGLLGFDSKGSPSDNSPDSLVNSSLHSVQEKQSSSTNNEIEKLQRENHVLQQLLGEPDDFTLSMGSEHTTRTAPNGYPSSLEKNLHIRPLRHSLKNVMLGHSSSLHSVPNQQNFRANKDTIQKLQREKEDSEQTIRTSTPVHSTMADLHIESFRNFLQESSSSLRSTGKQHSSRCDGNDTATKLRRENERLQQQLGVPKKETSIDSEDSRNDDCRTSLVDTLSLIGPLFRMLRRPTLRRSKIDLI